MHSEAAPKDAKSILLDEEDATGKSDAAPGKDHLRRGPAFSFFLSRAAAQPATPSDVNASHSVALVPVIAAVGAQATLDEVKRASRARWRFAAACLIAASLVVAGNGMYFGKIAYEATIRKAAEAKATKLQQERDRAAALASELATIHRGANTTVALSNKAGDEVTKVKQAAEKGSKELRQSLQKEQERAETLAQEIAMARARIDALEAQARQAGDHAAELKQTAEGAVADLRTSLQRERDRASRLEQDVAAAWREVEKQTALAAEAGEEARQTKQAAADSAAELQKSLEQEQERTARLEQDVAAARRDLEKQTARPAKASRQASQTKRRAASSAAGWYRSSSIWNYIFAPPRR